MSSIADQFHRLGREKRKGFVPFVTAGDPDLESSLAIVLKLAELGADVIELGVPFSDPVADGPTIQRSSQRALANGVNLSEILDLVRRTRESVEVPIVLFSYLNPLLRYGFARLSRDAAVAGVDAMLITDAVDEEASAFAQTLAGDGLDLISLVAPTTTDVRLREIAGRSSGFLYAVSRAGVTGARASVSAEAELLVERCRKITNLPVAVGFGISTLEQIADVWRYADAAVVGSAIVSEIEKAPSESVVNAVEGFMHRLLPPFAKSGAEL
ncbi:MAG TPA: tryptophan synthase subunit alpha [Pyrinomonadaceae bacterium]